MPVNAKELAPRCHTRGSRNLGLETPLVKGIAQVTGQRMHRASRNLSVPLRDSPRENLPRLPTTRPKLLKRDTFRWRGLPTAAIAPPYFRSLLKGRHMAFWEQSLERGILNSARGAPGTSRNGRRSTSRPPERGEPRRRTARARPAASEPPARARHRLREREQRPARRWGPCRSPHRRNGPSRRTRERRSARPDPVRAAPGTTAGATGGH